MKTMYVYILECNDNSYYVGVTNNMERRFQEHSKGINRNCYTYIRRPLKLVFLQIFSNPVSANAFEKKIKKWSRAKKKSLIENKLELLPELSRSSSTRNPTQMLRQAQHTDIQQEKLSFDSTTNF